MVGTGHPACVLTLHAGTTHKDVLYRVIEHMAHVKYTRHIWWRDNNRVRLTIVGF